MSPVIMIIPWAKEQMVTILTCFKMFIRLVPDIKLLFSRLQTIIMPIRINIREYFFISTFIDFISLSS